MNYAYASLVFLLLSPLALQAQLEASTLEELCRRAPYVATVRLSSKKASRTRIQVSFQATRWWKGERKGDIPFSEPAKAHCGSVLRGVKATQEYLLFFERRGSAPHILGGARGVIPKSKGVEAAIRSLLLVTDPAARSRLLAGQLADPMVRVREDAALALANLPGLESSTAVTRALILTHLDKAMPTPGSKGPMSMSLSPLLLAHARLDARQAALRAWSLAIDEDHSQLNSLGRQVLLSRIDGAILLNTVPLAQAKTHGSRLLLLDVLQGTRSPKALPWLQKLLEKKDPILQREVTVTMLSLGSQASELSQVVGKEVVLQAETLRAQRQGRPRLRAIRPR